MSWTAVTDFSSTGVLVVTSANPICHQVALEHHRQERYSQSLDDLSLVD